MKELKGKYTNAKVYSDTVEFSCIEQIKSMIDSPAFTTPVRIMPDTHAGKGSVIGFTMSLADKVVPNTIGVDIGCGIYAYKIKNKENIEGKLWEDIDSSIRKAVPLGFNYRESYEETIEEIENKMACQGKLGPLLSKIGIAESKALAQLGSLGGGNHFIEIAESNKDKSIWLLIHTGSRNVGKRVCDYHQERAIANIEIQRQAVINYIIETTPEQERDSALKKAKEADIFNVPKEQCWLEGKQKEEYVQDMYVAQKFAHVNKRMIKDEICSALGLEVEEYIETVHNFIDPRDNVIRKGAISAHKGEKVVIPFNMRDGSILAVGKGNEEWNNSAPHGAGRLMARGVAKRSLKLEDFRETMKDVWSTSVNSDTLDESPFAYKPKEEIEEAVSETVEVYDYLVPLYNLKDSNFNTKKAYGFKTK